MDKWRNLPRIPKPEGDHIANLRRPVPSVARSAHKIKEEDLPPRGRGRPKHGKQALTRKWPGKASQLHLEKLQAIANEIGPPLTPQDVLRVLIENCDIEGHRAALLSARVKKREALRATAARAKANDKPKVKGE